MTASQVLVTGILNPDGTLDLKEKPMLPPGPVEVVIRPKPAPDGGGGSWWEYLQAARGELLAQGHTFRTKEEIDDDRARQLSEDEARRRAIGNLQAPAE